jgi:hypothetical protein
MTYVYLDTNIYNDIERAAVPADDVRDFRAAVASGELVVRLNSALKTRRPSAFRG